MLSLLCCWRWKGCTAVLGDSQWIKFAWLQTSWKKGCKLKSSQEVGYGSCILFFFFFLMLLLLLLWLMIGSMRMRMRMMMIDDDRWCKWSMWNSSKRSCSSNKNICSRSRNNLYNFTISNRSKSNTSNKKQQRQEKRNQLIPSLGFPKMVGFPNWPMALPTKNDHVGVWNGGVPQPTI